MSIFKMLFLLQFGLNFGRAGEILNVKPINQTTVLHVL